MLDIKSEAIIHTFFSMDDQHIKLPLKHKVVKHKEYVCKVSLHEDIVYTAVLLYNKNP